MLKKIFILIIIASIVSISCNDKNQTSSAPSELPVVDENTETEILF